MKKAALTWWGFMTPVTLFTAFFSKINEDVRVGLFIIGAFSALCLIFYTICRIADNWDNAP